MVVRPRVPTERRSSKRRRSGSVAFLRRRPRAGSVWWLVALALALLGACTSKKMSAGNWQCQVEGETSDGGASDGGASQGPQPTDPVTVPWSTSFEDGFCGYEKVAGFCYGDSLYVVVTDHHHGGHVAAEFKVIGGAQNQTRCVRQGVFPESAYYGAWYLIPEALTEAPSPWNLWHFTGGDGPNQVLPGLWDVSLVKGAQAGDWELVVKDPLAPANEGTYRSADHKRIPIGSWFHIELFLKRATDASGKIALYQDGVLLFEQANLKSDASKFTQWYVGDWAESATPANSSLYVDDVSISATLAPTPATP